MASTKLAQDAEIKVGVLACEGRTFMAGADITEFGKPPLSPGLHEAHDARWRTPPNPSLPLFLAQPWAAAWKSRSPATTGSRSRAPKSDCRKSNSGILPGAGGTQRLPRLIGIEAALDMIISGDPIGAGQAAKAGVIDKLIDGDLLEGALSYAKDLAAQKAPPRKIRDINIDSAKLPAGFFDAARKRIAKEKRNLFSPQRIVDALEAAATLPFDQGMATRA